MLQKICPHCGKNVIETYGILNPYLYGSKLQKCDHCGGVAACLIGYRMRGNMDRYANPINDFKIRSMSSF